MVFGKLVAVVGDEQAPTELTAAVPIKKSITDDYIICLEDGKKAEDAEAPSDDLL